MLPWEVCQANNNCQYARFELTWTIGVVIGATLYGSFVTLGINCIYLLGLQRRKADALQCWLLQVYVFALLLVNTLFAIENFLWANFFSIFNSSTNPDSLITHFSNIQLVATLTIVVVGFLTDGLLVWRCYMVQRALVVAQSKIIRCFFWVFPALLWFTMIVTGASGAVAIREVETPGGLADAATVLLTVGMSANISLNLFTTTFIIMRVIMYRRFLKHSFGTVIPKHHCRVVGLLLESAAINIPTSVVAAVGIATFNTFGDFMMSVVVPGQSFASVLIIYQVAIGRAVGSSDRTDSERQTASDPVFMI